MNKSRWVAPAGITAGIIAGITAGITAGLASEITAGLASEITAGLASEITAGLASEITAGLTARWRRGPKNPARILAGRRARIVRKRHRNPNPLVRERQGNPHTSVRQIVNINRRRREVVHVHGRQR